MPTSQMLIAGLMSALGAASAVALWYAVCAINRMSGETRFAIRMAFAAKATGLFIVLCATLDYFHGDPLAWPWLLLAGVLTTNVGTSLLYLMNRRECRCPECPVRRSVVVLADRRSEP